MLQIEALLRSVPEIENTSRRTGLELGLAQVTEAHRGDMTIKLKADRTRSSDEIINELREKINAQFPLLKVEFPQLLSDMIGDLTSSPEPIEVKLFSQDPALLREWAPKLAASMDKIKGVVDVLDGIENTISGPVMTFKVDPSAVARAGLTPEEIQTDASALLQGAPAPNPVVLNGHAYTVRVRYPESARASINTIRDTLLVCSNGKTATLGALAAIQELPGPDRGTPRKSPDRCRRDGEAGGFEPGRGRPGGPGRGREAGHSIHDSRGVRRSLQGTAAVFPGSSGRAGRGGGAGIYRAAAGVSSFRRAHCDFGIGPAVFLRRFCRAASHPYDVQHRVIHGIDYGGRHCGQERNPFVGCRGERFHAHHTSAIQAMIWAGGRRLRPILMTALATVAGMIPLALGIGSGAQMLQPLAIAVIGGIIASLLFSLIVTPAVHYFIAGRRRVARRARRSGPAPTNG